MTQPPFQREDRKCSSCCTWCSCSRGSGWPGACVCVPMPCHCHCHCCHCRSAGPVDAPCSSCCCPCCSCSCSCCPCSCRRRSRRARARALGRLRECVYVWSESDSLVTHAESVPASLAAHVQAAAVAQHVPAPALGSASAAGPSAAVTCIITSPGEAVAFSDMRRCAASCPHSSIAASAAASEGGATAGSRSFSSSSPSITAGSMLVPMASSGIGLSRRPRPRASLKEASSTQ